MHRVSNAASEATLHKTFADVVKTKRDVERPPFTGKTFALFSALVEVIGDDPGRGAAAGKITGGPASDVSEAPAPQQASMRRHRWRTKRLCGSDDTCTWPRDVAQWIKPGFGIRRAKLP